MNSKFSTFKKFKYEIGVFVFYILSRLPSLGFDIFNTDVWKWKQRIYDFGTGVFTLEFAKTIQRYHPGVMLMWIGTASVKVFNFMYDIVIGTNPPDNIVAVVFQLHFFQKFSLVIVAGLILAFVFNLLRRLFRARTAALIIILVALEPFFVALTRVVHLEGLMSIFMLASFVSAYYFVAKSKNIWHIIYSAVFASMAVLTKTSALFLVAFIEFLLFAYRLWDSKKFFHSLGWSLKYYFIWLLVSVGTFFALWPAMWTNASDVFEVLKKGIVTVGVEGGHEQWYFGKWVEDPGAYFYPVVIWFRASLYMVLGVVGSIFAFKKFSAEKKKFVTFALLFAVLYVVEITIPSKKLGRYVLPSFVMLSAITAIFFDHILEFISTKFNKNYIKVAILGLVPLIFTLFYIHPDYFSYFNPLAGGLKSGIHALEPKWIIGHHELIEYLEDKRVELGLGRIGPGETVYNMEEELPNIMILAFPEKYYTQIYPFIWKMGGWATIDSISIESRKAQFFIYPVWFDSTDHKDSRELIEQVYLRGVPVYNIYKNTDRTLE